MRISKISKVTKRQVKHLFTMRYNKGTNNIKTNNYLYKANKDMRAK